MLLLGRKYIFFSMYRFLKKFILPKANCFTILVLYVYNVIFLFKNNNNKVNSTQKNCPVKPCIIYIYIYFLAFVKLLQKHSYYGITHSFKNRLNSQSVYVNWLSF